MTNDMVVSKAMMASIWPCWQAAALNGVMQSTHQCLTSLWALQGRKRQMRCGRVLVSLSCGARCASGAQCPWMMLAGREVKFCSLALVFVME